MPYKKTGTLIILCTQVLLQAYSIFCILSSVVYVVIFRDHPILKFPPSLPLLLSPSFLSFTFLSPLFPFLESLPYREYYDPSTLFHLISSSCYLYLLCFFVLYSEQERASNAIVISLLFLYTVQCAQCAECMDIWQGALSNVSQGHAFCFLCIFSRNSWESKGDKYFIAICYYIYTWIIESLSAC